MSLICLASLGRCSPTDRPGTPVAIGLNGPPLAWSGLGSKVSIWRGPPVIHRRMTDFLRFGSVAALAARVSIHPEADAPMAPAEARRNQSRRESCGFDRV